MLSRSFEKGLNAIAKRREAKSAVKIDVSDVSSSCDSKVLVLSHESSTRDVITSLLKKLKMRDYDARSFVVEAEILADQDVAILQFDDEDRLMQAYQQFPKGTVRLCMRYKSEFGMDIADEKREGKTGLNGHQLTLQRIRRSLEKLKRKSGTTAKTTGSSSKTTEPAAPSAPRSARPPIKPQSPTKVKSQGVSASTSRVSPSTSVSTPRGSGSTPRGTRTSSTGDKSTTPSNGATDRRREYRNRAERSRRRSYAGDEHNGHKSPYGLSNTKHLSYKATTVPQSSSGAASDTECMIFYDSASDAGSVSHLPSQNSARSHVMPRHIEIAHNKQSVMIDKPMKMSFKNLEDSGIDVKSPPNSANVRERVNSMGDLEYRKPTPSKPTTNGHSQESYVSPTLSESSPFSFMSANEGNHVKRTGSFSSLKSLPVTVFKEPGGSPFMFEPINQERLSRTKSQSMTNLHNNKVVRRRSLPPLDVSQEKLEQKKSSLSKRLAKKISNFRNNEKRYMLPSPHTFTSQNLHHYKQQDKHKGSGDNTRHVGDNRDRKADDNDDNVSEADMEVACILEGKPAHPTDSDVEDYLACVESTNTTQSESVHGEHDVRHEALEPYSQIDKYHQSSKIPKQPHSYVDHNKNSQKQFHVDSVDSKNSQRKHVNEPSAIKQKTASKYEYQVKSHDVNKSHDIGRSMDKPHDHGKPMDKSHDMGSNLDKSRDNGRNLDKSHDHSRNLDKSHDIGKSIDSGIESSYSRTLHVKPVLSEKPRIVNGAAKPKKSLNKFVEQSMQSFLNDCHNSTTLTDAEILEIHRAALQENINSPSSDAMFTAKLANQNVKSSPGKSTLEFELMNSQNGLNPPSNAVHNNHVSSNQSVSDYEQARPKLSKMALNTGTSDATNGSQTSRSDTTYKSNVQLKLQTQGLSKTKDTDSRRLSENYLESIATPRRRSSFGSDRAILNQSSKDKYKQEQSEDEWAGKPLTLFAIVRTHSILSVFIEKGSSKTFGIKVKRVLFTNCGQVKDTAGSHNVVVVQELVPNSPSDAAATILPDDIIIEINGHNVLQSSDKVVKTLLDARSVLEMVIARENKRMSQALHFMDSSTPKSPLIFHNMDEIPAETVNFNYEPTTGQMCARSKQYEQRTEPVEFAPNFHIKKYEHFEQKQSLYEQNSGHYENRQGHIEQGYMDPDPAQWNAKIAQYDSVITSPRFNQLSEGPTFLL